MKPTFLKYDKPLLTAMIQYPTPFECIVKIKASIADGADAIGIQLDKLKREYITKECLSEIFRACGGRPIYVTCYRDGTDCVYKDDECAEVILLALECGATLCDVMGDMFGVSPELGLTEDKDAVVKQKALIDEIHRRGGEVLMSSHTARSTSVEENLRIAKAQSDRGADVVKIVCVADSENEVPKYIESIQRIKETIDKELLLLVTGKGEIIRYIGANFGVCMYLCVQHHGPLDTTSQPVLKNVKAIRDNIRFDV